MGSLELKNALRDAGLTPEELAEVIQVDPKSVTRWLAGQATPYPRHRANIARALNLTETDLWPELHHPTPTTTPAAEQVSEVIAGWAHAHAPGIPDLAQLVLDTDGNIDMFEGNRDFKPTEALVDAILTRAREGRRVRFMTRAPTMVLAPLIGHPNIQVALWAERNYDMLEDYLRAGSTILRGVRLHRGDNDLVVLLIKRQADGGLYDRITEDFEFYWDQIEENPISNQEHQHIPDLQTLEHFAWDEEELDQLRNGGDEPEDEADDNDKPGDGNDPEPPPRTQPTNSKRRWPGRTD